MGRWPLCLAAVILHVAGASEEACPTDADAGAVAESFLQRASVRERRDFSSGASAAGKPRCRRWCEKKVAKGKRDWATLCGLWACSACSQCSTPAAPPAGAPTTAAPTAPPEPYVPVAIQQRMPGAESPESSRQPTSCPDASDAMDLGASIAQGGGDVITLPAGRYVVRVAVDLGFRSLVIPQGAEVLLADVDGAELAAEEIVVRGALRAGSASCPVTARVRIKLQSTPEAERVARGEALDSVRAHVRKEGIKGLVVEDGGVLELFGRRPFPTWTRLAAVAERGERHLRLQDAVDWRPGDEVVVVTTVFRDDPEDHQNERRTVEAVEGKTLVLSEPLRHLHYAGEYSAEVALLSRSLVVSGDERSVETSFGGHTLCLKGARCRISGVRGLHMGQRNVMGKYPFHLHLMGAVGGDSYFEDNVVDSSFFRAFTIHGTHHTRVARNVAFNITGNAYYLEDGVEQYNNFTFNLAAHVNIIKPLQDYLGTGGQNGVRNIRSTPDRIVSPDVAASGFYCTNAKNRWVGNSASGGFSGFAFPAVPTVLGLSYESHKDYKPDSEDLLEFDSNTAHSTGRHWRQHGSCVYVGGGIENSPRGSSTYIYNYGRFTPNRKAGRFIFTNLKTAACTKGVVFWGSGHTASQPHMLLQNFEAHDVSKAAHFMGNCGLDRGVVTAHTENRARGDFGSAPLPATSELFKQYDLNMQTVLSGVAFRGLRGGDVAVSDVGSSTTITSALSLSKLQFNGAAPERRIRHEGTLHCRVRSNLANKPHSPCNGGCERKCPGTSSGSQITFIEADGSVVAGALQMEGGVLLGSGDREAETSGTNDWWRLDDCAAFQGFWACPTHGRRYGAMLRVFDGHAGRQDLRNPEVPNADALPATVYQFGHTGRRLRMDKGVTTINGPCCDVGWYFSFDGGAPRKFTVFASRVASSDGPLLATSFPPGASIAVEQCGRHGCIPLTAAANIEGLRAAAVSGFLVDAESRLFLRILDAENNDAFSIGGVDQLKKGRDPFLYFQVTSSKDGAVVLNLPP